MTIEWEVSGWERLRPIQRTAHAQLVSGGDVRIDHGRLQIGVNEKLPDGADVVAVLDQVSGVSRRECTLTGLAMPQARAASLTQRWRVSGSRWCRRTMRDRGLTERLRVGNLIAAQPRHAGDLAFAVLRPSA